MEPHNQERLEIYKNILKDMRNVIYEEKDIEELRRKLPLFDSFTRKAKNDYKEIRNKLLPDFLKLINITLDLLS
jgi:hypothetical protein